MTTVSQRLDNIEDTLNGLTVEMEPRLEGIEEYAVLSKREVLAKLDALLERIVALESKP